MPRPCSRFGKTSPWLSVAAASLFLLFCFCMLPYGGYPRWAAEASQCKNNLKQIELALHNYHDTHGSFPPAITYGPDGKPWHSWRTLILPLLEQGPLFERYRFDEPWNGPNNRQLVEEFPSLPVFLCPGEKKDVTTCSYFAVIGEHTMWPPHGSVSFEDIPDGSSNVIHVVEVSDSGLHWMQPADLRLDAMTLQVPATKGVGPRSHHSATGDIATAQVNFGIADGSTRLIHPSVPPETLRSYFIRDDGRLLD